MHEYEIWVNGTSTHDGCVEEKDIEAAIAETIAFCSKGDYIGLVIRVGDSI